MFKRFYSFPTDKMLPQNTETAIVNYLNDGPVNLAYVKDLLIDFIEPKNLKDETLLVSELSNELINIKNMIKKSDFDNAKVKFEKLLDKLNNL